MIYSASLIYTLIALVIKIIPNDKIYWHNITSGNNKIYQLKPRPLQIKKIKIIGIEIKKFTNPLVATEIGKISLGKYTFLMIPAFPNIVKVPCDITVVKKFHGKIPITI